MAKYPADLAVIIRERLEREKIIPPDLDAITKFLEVIYFVSLKTEESEHVKCWVTFLDPKDPNSNPPFGPRSDRWSVVRLTNRLRFDTRNLVKFAPAADPWSTAVAVYYDQNELFIWGLVDQMVHTSTSLVRESPPGYAPPGIFYAIAEGTAELSVYREDGLIARLRQDAVVDGEYDVLWRGPIYKKLLPPIRSLRRYVIEEVAEKYMTPRTFRLAALKRNGLGP